MAPSVLITECLQNDFVRPIGRHDSLPNLLHVGHGEALRLMGEDPEEGPIARVMKWASGHPDDALRVIHIRDWHDPEDPIHRAHLEQFGEHCIQGTEGAAFAFEETCCAEKNVPVVSSFTLNSFLETSLEAILEQYRGRPARVGIVGVWTEAKITFLAYELSTRYPEFEVGVCSALTASSSRSAHFLALDQMERLLGVRIFPSTGQFTEWLGGDAVPMPLVGFSEKHPEVFVHDMDGCSELDRKLLHYLFRDCRSVECRVLDGGYSGNVVVGTESVDLIGQRQAPHVVKIGPRDMVGRERTSFERIESVLGNAAPRIADHADLEDRGAIKYRYASMGGTFATTFQKRYMEGLPLPEIRRILDTVFGEKLGRFYSAAQREKCDLLEYYDFDGKWAPLVRETVETVIGKAADEKILNLAGRIETPNICRFYENTLAGLRRRSGESHYMAYVHGDLNGANIILDQNENVWIIDFFHAHRGHVLRDLIKLENDLLYIFTPVEGPEDLAEACRFSDLLFEVKDLCRMPPDPDPPFRSESFRRAYETVRILRSFYRSLIKTDRDPLQLVIGQMRYAVHTLTFDESSRWQKLWALYTSGRCAERIEKSMQGQGKLRVDWVDERFTAPGRLGITILPGRVDYGRDLGEDLDVIRREGITHLVSLVPEEELAHYGVESLLYDARQKGIDVHHRPMLDQKVVPFHEMASLVDWMGGRLREGARVLVTCVGGLGRSGTVAACTLMSRGLDAEKALAEVRRTRGPRAVESLLQEDFVRAYGHPKA